MRILLPLIILILPLFPCLADDGPPERSFRLPAGVTSKDYLPNTVIVKYKKDSFDLSRVSSMARSLKLKSAPIQQISQVFKESLSLAVRKPPAPLARDTVGLERIFEFKYSGKSSVESTINQLLKDPAIEYAEPSYIYRTKFIPNDELYTSGQNYLRQVRAESAWDVIRDASGVVIAIVDSGSDMDHPDLKANLVLPGKDLVGASFSNMVEDDDPDVKSDVNDHGVRVSGIAGAVSNNLLGIASAGYNARLLIVKAASDDNAEAIYRGYEGIKYAADRGAHIINCSWGGPGGGAYGQDIINYAISRGCLVVAAAGNDNTSVPDFPSAYRGVLAVGSVDASDRRSNFSNYGPHVTLSAPGELLTTANGGSYVVARGTSFSAPLVASAAALVKSRFPAFDALKILEQLRVTADNIDAYNSGYNGLVGSGRLNLFRAVSELLPSIRQQNIILADKGRGSIPPGDTLRISFDLKNLLSPIAALQVSLSSENSNVEIIDKQHAIAALATDESVRTAPFRVFIRRSVSDNEEVGFKIRYTAGGYSDAETFVVRVARDYINVNVNQIATTVSSNGRVGFAGNEARNGVGFVYKDQQLLYEGALMIATSPTRVSNNARNDFGGSDEHFVKKSRVGEFSSSPGTFRASSTFSDSANPTPLNLTLTHSQQMFSAAPDDKYTIAEYEIRNSGNEVLEKMYVGLFTDWDISGNSNDATRFDPISRLAYVYAKNNQLPYAGVKLLNTSSGLAYSAMSSQIPGDPLQSGGGFSLAEKYESLSQGIRSNSLGESSPAGYDVAFVSGYGPLTLPVNASVKVAFALIAGDNLSDLEASAQAAQNKYDELNGKGTHLPPMGFELGQNHPNPASGTTVIQFSLAEEGNTSLSLFDIRGQKMRDLVSASLPKGQYTVTVDLSGLTPGVYVYRMVYQGKEKSIRMLVGQ